MNGQDRYLEWKEMADTEIRTELEIIQNDPKEIEDRFSSDLKFGTGGLRGVLGAGTNRMNRYVVRRASRGLAEYLIHSQTKLFVAVSYDSRINSKLFAEETAYTLTAYGIDVWIYPRLEPTPALSWAVRRLSCGAGVMITASHNRAEYNGYKVYGSDGCQITDKIAADILTEIQSHGYFDSVSSTKKGIIRQIPENILNEFLKMELLQVPRNLKGLKVVYTPLNGSGLECVQRVLREAQIDELTIVPEQKLPDGRFPTCSEPNPENPNAMTLGLKLCEKQEADLFLATDPDCDRVGVVAKNGTVYKQFTGNQIGVLLFDYLCKSRIEQGKMPNQPIAFTTIVSTEMASAIAKHYGVELKRTLTGFKYIGEQIGLLEKNSETERFIFAFEESCGYLSNSHIRDKDAINAVLLICEMAVYYKEKGQTLWQVFDELEKQYGMYTEELYSHFFPGTEGLKKMKKIMGDLREHPPKKIAGIAVNCMIDYLKSEMTGLPVADVLAFYLQDGGRVIIRPSGTEPKMKIYISENSENTELSEILKTFLKG